MISPRALNRATLARQMLLQRESVDVLEAVRRIVAIQAQHPASPYVALWNRLTHFDPAVVDEAFHSRKLVKGTLMRFTLHAVHSDDHLVMHSAMQPTLRTRFVDARYIETGVTREDAEAVIPDVVDYLAEPRTSTQIEAWVAERFGVPPRQVWNVLRCIAPLLHAPTGGPWLFGHRPSFVASEAAITPYDKEVSDRALETLVLRYLEGFGPASIADVAEFTKVQRGRARVALEALPVENSTTPCTTYRVVYGPTRTRPHPRG